MVNAGTLSNYAQQRRLPRTFMTISHDQTVAGFVEGTMYQFTDMQRGSVTPLASFSRDF